MGKFIEILAMGLGGISLFAVCFLGFAMTSGKPLDEVAGIGGFFDPTEIAEPPTEIVEAPSDRALTQRRSQGDIVRSGIGVMSAWSLPSPYSIAELSSLTDELKGRLQQIEVEEANLDQRERELDEEARTLAERFESMENLRVELEAFERRLDLREREVLQAENSASERETRKWSDVAAVLEALDTSVAGQRLVEYEPDDAAKVLRAMTPDTAAEILNQLAPERWKEYVEAYTALTAEPR
jgi:flagellar motility protein MotE (MotC chaperone)